MTDDGTKFEHRGIQVPQAQTLKKYGLSQQEWCEILDAQDGVCGSCGRVPPSGRLVTDHEHVRGWKAMPPERRKFYVRGVVCFQCNHYALRRGMTQRVLRGAADYLDRYERRRP